MRSITSRREHAQRVRETYEKILAEFLKLLQKERKNFQDDQDFEATYFITHGYYKRFLKGKKPRLETILNFLYAYDLNCSWFYLVEFEEHHWLDVYTSLNPEEREKIRRESIKLIESRVTEIKKHHNNQH